MDHGLGGLAGTCGSGVGPGGRQDGQTSRQLPAGIARSVRVPAGFGTITDRP